MTATQNLVSIAEAFMAEQLRQDASLMLRERRSLQLTAKSAAGQGFRSVLEKVCQDYRQEPGNYQPSTA